MKEKDGDKVKILRASCGTSPVRFKEAADMVVRGIYMDGINKFLEEGRKHGTVVEALYEAFRAIQTGEADDIPSALHIGASEWYK